MAFNQCGGTNFHSSSSSSGRIFEVRFETKHQIRLKCHMLCWKCAGKIWHYPRLDWARHDTIDHDVMITGQNRRNGSDVLVNTGFCCTVLRERRVGVDPKNAAGDDDLSTLATAIVRHVVCRKMNTENRSFQVHIGTCHIGFFRYVVLNTLDNADFEVVLRIAVHNASVSDHNIKALPLFPNFFKQGPLGVVDRYIALNEDSGIAIRVQLGRVVKTLLFTTTAERNTIALSVQQTRYPISNATLFMSATLASVVFRPASRRSLEYVL
jgi:hypothetical protein